MKPNLRDALNALAGNKEFDPEYAARSEEFAVESLIQERLIAITAFGPDLAQGLEETFQIIQERALTIKERSVLGGLIIMRLIGLVDYIQLERVRMALLSSLPSESNAILMSDEMWRYSMGPDEASLETLIEVKPIGVPLGSAPSD